jgi:N-acetylglucosaminyl-diphospho-decaprenol L-rhamnosyltransferase
MLREHHKALFRYLSRQYSGPAYAPVRLVLGVGLLLRYLLAARVRSVGEGAAPTRPAAVLEDARREDR